MQLYLIRIVCGAIISAILQSFPLRGTIRKLVVLSCGCLMVVLTVAPLLRMDFNHLTAQLSSSFSYPMPEVSSRNDELLQQLICEQTEDLIEQTAQAQGTVCTAAVTLKYDETVGSYVPYSVRVSVSQSVGTIDALKAFLTEDLAIPEERQTWVLN